MGPIDNSSGHGFAPPGNKPVRESMLTNIPNDVTRPQWVNNHIPNVSKLVQIEASL